MNKKSNIRGRIIAATPMICLIAYLAIGFTLNVWHPTWAVFFLIPLMPFLLGTKSITSIITYPFLCLAVYIVLGVTLKWWHPGWLIFLTIPVYYTLVPRSVFKKEKKKDSIIIDYKEES